MISKLELDSEVGKGSNFHFTLKTKLEIKRLDKNTNPKMNHFSSGK